MPGAGQANPIDHRGFRPNGGGRHWEWRKKLVELERSSEKGERADRCEEMGIRLVWPKQAGVWLLGHADGTAIANKRGQSVRSRFLSF